MKTVHLNTFRGRVKLRDLMLGCHGLNRCFVGKNFRRETVDEVSSSGHGLGPKTHRNM